MIRRFHPIRAIRRYASSPRSFLTGWQSRKGISETFASSSPSRPLQLSVLLGMAQATCIYHLIQTYIIELSGCTGPSMLPTLAVKGDYIIINKWYRRGRGIVVGDLVDFVHPIIPGIGAVKRIVGMPGDFVVSHYTGGIGRAERENIVERDSSGNIILKSKGIGDPMEELATGRKRQQKMIQVPEGHCWILGDNLSESRDSRVFGPLPLALIKGKVVARVLPWEESGWLVNNFQKIG